jgi:uncharacterized OB-fold protein
LDSAKYNKAMELVALFAAEPDALGAAVDYLEAMHTNAGGSRKRARTESAPMMMNPFEYAPQYAPMATMAAPQYMYAPSGGQQAKTPKGAPIEGVDGNWRCPACSNINFGVRDVCNRCKAPKPANLEAPAPAATAPRVNPVAGVDGNWECTNCGAVNFANREVCFKCKAGKDGTPPSEPTAAASKGAPREGENGNWRCPSCGNVNFAIRTACNRCKAPKPAPMMAMPGMPGMPGGMPMMAMPMGAMSYEMPAMGSSRPKGNAPVEGEDGNWKCDGCGNVNFKFREACNRCGKAKPSA